MIDKKAIGYHNLSVALDMAAMDAEEQGPDEDICKAIRELSGRADERKDRPVITKDKLDSSEQPSGSHPLKAFVCSKGSETICLERHGLAVPIQGAASERLKEAATVKSTGWLSIRITKNMDVTTRLTRDTDATGKE